ncbi:MFS transporter [Amycolatopsis magusensis]|uniref:MFS transporter n=1 Tax=Amycolatopsis magusensis TaxID=882444 RepID=UPI0024A9A82C|nr:MFS transporter [Amycolatopsis magusensis]MDI5976754.1 MFS transporter [Amycolatopsis magusensis]
MEDQRPQPPEPSGATARPPRRQLARAFTASLTGTALEWYDFGIYSASAALVFPVLFFPSGDPIASWLLAFSTYAVGYLSRPLGAFFLGKLGDVVGRKQIIVVTLLLIGVATLLIGVLPTFATVGVAAPILLVLLRFAQGVGVGGELGVAPLLSSEFGDPARRGLWCSAPQMGPAAGTLLANGVLALLTTAMSREAFLSWGWRVGFLASALLIAVGLWVRLKLEDTPIFRAIRERGEQPTAPVREVFRTELRGLVAASSARVGPDVVSALFVVFTLVYGTSKAGFTSGEVLVAVLAGSAGQLVFVPIAAALSDRINRRLQYVVAAVAAAIWPFVFLPAIVGASLGVLVGGVVIGLGLHSFMYGPQGALITEQFSPRLRSTGSSLGFAIGSTFGGAVAPLIFTALLGWQDSWFPVACYVAVACAVTIVGVTVFGRNHDMAEEAAYQPGPVMPARSAQG